MKKKKAHKKRKQEFHFAADSSYDSEEQAGIWNSSNLLLDTLFWLHGQRVWKVHAEHALGVSQSVKIVQKRNCITS